jgi:DNA uptake protein ComE-like DNA-binding protein
MIRRLILSASAVAFSAGLALAQAPNMPVPPITAPIQPNKTMVPPATAPSTAPAQAKTVAPNTKTAKVNLNTATDKELDTLPEIGPARVKAIIEARKTKFKNWEDFEARKVVPADALKAIKDKVSF